MQRYEIPLDTKVEIISEGSRFNRKIGSLGAKDPSGLLAHNVWFENGEFDCFMDDEFLPLQNIVIIDNLDYDTLCKLFEHDYLYETDRVVIKSKKFTHEEIQKNLSDFAQKLTEEFREEKYRDKSGKIIDLLVDILGYDEGNFTAIQEMLMFEQWKIEGLRNHCTKNCKTGKKRYFNPEAEIEIISI